MAAKKAHDPSNVPVCREAAANAPLKVLIADDHPLIVLGIRRTLDADDEIEVVGEAHSGAEVLALIERRRPDLVLLDLRMPGTVGTSCIEQITESWPGVKIVVLSACDDRASIDAALRAGASAYIVKSVKPVDIASVLRQTKGGAVFSAPSMSAGAMPAQAPAPSGPMLTEREAAILTAVASGLTTKAISQELWVSEHTVKFHLTNIYRKLGVTNRTSAVRYAIEHDLVELAA
jgi:DNA-binding NarL/FixJ family response regulator